MTATSSRDSEAIEWAAAAKTTLRVAAAVEATRLTPICCEGLLDNDAVRTAVDRGYSGKMAHLNKYAEVGFGILRDSGIKLARIDTSENWADMFTKVPFCCMQGRVHLLYLYCTHF